MGSKCSKKRGEEEWDKYMVDNSSRPTSPGDGGSEKVRFDADLPQEEGPKINWDALEKETQALNLSHLREDFQKNPDQFLINLILMSVQFFKHFEKDKEGMLINRDTLKKEFDERIVDLKKNSILWDGYFSKIQEYVSFQEEESGTFDPSPLEALQGQECFFCYNNIDTNRHEEYHSLRDGSSQYSQLDNPIYRVCLEPANHSGFVKLRCVDDPSMFTPRQTSSTESLDDEDEDDELDEEEEINLNHNVHHSKPSNEDVQVRPKGIGFNPLVNKVSFQSEVFIEEEEEEDEEDDGPTLDFMNALASKIDNQNYLVNKPPTPTGEAPNMFQPNFKPKVFQPSAQEEAKVIQPGSNTKKQFERRPSGVMPDGWERQAQLTRLRAIQNKNITNGSSEKVEKKEKKKAIVEEDDDIYGYAYHKPIPLSMGQLGENRRVSNSIPNSCFQTVEVKIVDDEDTDPYPIDAELENRIYLSSKRFMWHFTSQFYDIASRIGKRSLAEQGAKSLGPAVICMEEIEDTYKELQWKFIPSVEVGFWPDEGLEWLLRRRKVMRDRRTGVTYQWPERHQIDAAKQIGCNIVPIGFNHPKKNIENPDADTEWKIEFTKAEMIIVKNLHHPKVRVYTFAILLFKSCFEKIGAVDATHIKYICYWLMEQSPGDWTEENIGEKFLLVLKFLKKHVTSQKMPNYFISKSNMFANIPNHKLREAQEKVHRIQEKPVFYLMDCLMKLRYEKNFYPMPELARLYKILTTDSQLSLLNPNLVGSAAARVDGKWDKGKGKQPAGDRHQAKMRAFREKIEAEAKKAKKENERRKKVIDFNAEVKPFDEIRAKLILEFFIAHFLKMASKSNEFRNSGQGLMFVLQAENLMAILKDIGFDETLQTQEFRQDIFRLKEVSRFSIREYWSINYGHAELSHKQSFRTKSPHLDSPLPKVPSRANSPVRGVEGPRIMVESDPGERESPPLARKEISLPKIKINVEVYEEKDVNQNISNKGEVLSNGIVEEDEAEEEDDDVPDCPQSPVIVIADDLDDTTDL